MTSSLLQARRVGRTALALSAIALAAGCAVGPDYVRPALPASASYAPASSTSPAADPQAQRFSLGRDIQADWWKVFGSPALDALIERAFAANPNLEAAQAALREAQENVAAQRGFFFPTVQAGYTPTRTKIAGNLGGNSPGLQGNGRDISTGQGTPASEGGSAPFTTPVIYNFHTAQLTVGYVPDVFGGNRRQMESMASQAQVQLHQLQATYITLASNIVAAAIQDALLREQIALTEQIVEANTASLALVQRQLKAGQVSRLELALQDNALAQSKQALPPLRKQFEQNRDLLRALAGQAQDDEAPIFKLDALRLPGELPLTLPSRLVEQRPDVRAAEEQLRAANAEIGVARAARLPQFSINATVGGAASRFNQMFWNSGRFFDLALGITQPLFDGGTLRHKERAAIEQQRQAAAQYRATVIVAFQNVADTLHAIEADAAALSAAAAVSDTAKTALDLTRRQHGLGYLDRLALIAAEQNHRQGQLGLLQARAARLADSALLFQALGGGWWHRDAAALAANAADAN
ncbi:MULTISPECIES: efflux transporter outer membrane subunit [unclassified Variovorax]|uniref:efflux transporter outer membrane subunit n=1 Tax=unclassified Variovorax TaxID=663243 RepID=UPI0025779E1E|nr:MULTISPECIES: efflux transporter outer membrane subunit [unclassified Variovorax]MDM0086860.1 efflux transporter outer membrane subunit [Variovorax sp. J22G40]MDM0144884.1 efflux transporter outer membrane subunit [Variovorax sp. J2P1-31]